MSFFTSWLGFSLLMFGVVTWFVGWALRSGQFRGQDRARFLALQSDIPTGTGQQRSEDDAAA